MINLEHAAHPRRVGGLGGASSASAVGGIEFGMAGVE